MIWDFQEALTRRLLLWSALSMIAGGALLLFGDAFWRGFGLQALVWGVIDAGIAIFGRRSANKRLSQAVDSGADLAALADREARNLRRLLWINTGLDVLYVLGGIILLRTLGQGDPFAAGNGWGVIVQGAFLFLFDLVHALTVPEPLPPPPWPDAFAGPEHRPFTLAGGERAALLLHGFLGTPAEMRGLGEALHAQGWTVHAPLLPGFGSDVQTLTARRWQEWAAAVRREANGLSAEGRQPLLFVGYSMGAALSLMAATGQRVDGLVLLAPFSFPEPWWLKPVEFVLRPFLPLGFRPMRRADFSNPQLRQGITGFMPGVDLDDPDVQAAVRSFRVPLGLIDQLRAVSRGASTAARHVNGPVLVVQGSRDRVSRPANTRRLISELPEPAAYVEVDSDHNVTDTSNAAWPEVSRAVLDFAARIAASTR